MLNKEGISHLANDWYKDPNSGNICIDAEKADAFLEAVELGIEAMKALSAKPTDEQPLSVEQLREMVSRPYWHVGLRADSAPPHWSILDPLLAYYPEKYEYGMAWLAYAYPPVKFKRGIMSCAGCDFLDRDRVPCDHCIRAAGYADYYKPQQPSK